MKNNDFDSAMQNYVKSISEFQEQVTRYAASEAMGKGPAKKSNCFGCAGTFGTFGGTFGTAGTFGCWGDLKSPGGSGR